MSNIYQMPKQDIEKIEWNGDYKDYDYKLFQLGQGHNQFIIINPAFANLKLQDKIEIVNDSNRCIVWKYKDQWIAKYFNKHWEIERRYTEIDIDIDIKWYRNPELDSNIVFDQDPTNQPIEDLYNLNYEMVWYLNEQFNPTKDKVWVMKCSLKGFTPIGTKDMGYISPKVIYNPDLPDLEYIITEHIPYYDLVYEHIWMVDDMISGASNIWGAKITPTNLLGTKIVGTIEIDLPKQLDVVFISYNEPNAEENWRRVLKKSPKAFRVNGIKGIVNAHKCAAELVSTDMFYVVDGDAYLTDDWSFEYQPRIFDRDCVHVWSSLNPINGLEYGYGGIKLLPRQLTLDVDVNCVDMTTSISTKFKTMSKISNITAFNTSEYNTFRSAFRECAKLSSNILKRQLTRESSKRLDIWCTVGEDNPFGNWAIAGALAGKKFGLSNRGNTVELQKINDSEWIRAQFNNLTR
jgi:hypothetical protein